MWDKIKQHPWVIAALVGVFILVLLFSSSSSSSGTAATATTSDGSGDQLAAYQASLNQQGQIASINAGVQNQQTAAAVTVARLQSASTDNANTLAAQVAEYTSKLAADVKTNSDTLSAQTTQYLAAQQSYQVATQISANVTQANLAATTSMHNTDTLAAALTAQSAQQAQTTQAWISALPGIVGTQSNAQVAIAQANHPQCTSVLFGLFSSC